MFPCLGCEPAEIRYIKRGNDYYEKGQYDQAISWYSKIIEMNPRLVAAYNNRGWSYDKKGEYDKAIRDYTEALKILPKFAWGHYNRGLSYYRKGEYDKAFSDYTTGKMLAPASAAAAHKDFNRYVPYRHGPDTENVRDKIIELLKMR